MNLLLQFIINGMVNGAVYSLIAISFGIIYRSTRIFDLSIGAYYTLSAYLLYTLFVLLKLPLLLSVFISVFMIIIFEFVNERFIFRPFFNKGASSGAILVASLGLYTALVNLITLIWGNEVKILNTGIQKTFNFRGGIILSNVQLLQFSIGVLITAIIYLFIKFNKKAKTLWAMGDKPILIKILGLPLNKLRMFAYISSGLLISVASILTAIDIGVDPHVGLMALLNGAIAVIIGGSDKFEGWILGSFVLAELNAIGSWKLSMNWTPLITFGLLIIMLLLKPSGLIGTSLRAEEQFERGD